MKKSKFKRDEVWRVFFLLLMAGVIIFFLSFIVKAEEGYFVKVEDKVYFRKFGKEALEKTALWGDYFNYPTKKGGSQICVYDKNTAEAKLAFKDNGGKLYYDGQTFYLEGEDSESENNRVVYTVNKNGQEVRILGYGTIKDLSDKGYLVTEVWEEGSQALEVFKNEDKLLSVGTKKAETHIGYMGIAGDYVLYNVIDYNEKKQERYADIFAVSLDATSEPVKLGKVNLTKEMADGIDVGNVQLKNGKLYFSLFYVGGTGHFVYNGYVYLGNPKAKNSLKKVTKDIYGKYEMKPVFKVTDKGKIKLSKYEKNTVVVEGKAVYLFKSDSNKKLVTKDYTKLFRSSKTGDYDVASAKYIDGAVFMIVHKQKRDPKEDIGWREAYKVLERYYVRVSLEGENNVTILHEDKF